MSVCYARTASVHDAVNHQVYIDVETFTNNIEQIDTVEDLYICVE
jgi:predicted RNA-binding protein associated with RNAse of E/G family